MPPALHDVFGREQTLLELSAPDMLAAQPLWRSALALILVLDIAAGCVANFTRSTNDFYAARPRNRWIFIAVHVHVVVVALLLGADLAAALAVWGYTIVGAVSVNRLRGHPLQTFVAGLLLATGLVGVSLWPGLSPLLAAVSALFLLKVLFSFAVDHYRTVPPEAA